MNRIALAVPAVFALSMPAWAQTTTASVSEQITEAIGFGSVSTDVIAALVVLGGLTGAFFVYRMLKRTSTK